MEEMTAGICT